MNLYSQEYSMNKKTLALITLIIVLVAGLTACNGKTYKAQAIPEGNKYASSPVENNGGVVVRQGNYIYFINAYTGVDAENTFGKQDKSCLMRATLDESGNVIEGSVVEVVKKNVYSTSAKSGIYVKNGWIYYATPNLDKTKQGEVNSTYLDFYRTSLDATRTELLHTINNRSVDFTVTDNAILVLDGGTLKKIDLNKKNAAKISDDKNYVTVRENVSFMQPVKGSGEFAGYTIILTSADTENSWKKYNTLSVIDATGEITDLITDGSYNFDENAASYNTNATVAVKDYVIESDGLTLYYTKTDANGNVTLCAYKFAKDLVFDRTKEVVLMEDASGSNASTVNGIDFENGAIVSVSSAPYLKYVQTDKKPQTIPSDGVELLARAVTVYAVKDGYIFYADSSSPAALYRFDMTSDDNPVEEKVADVSIATAWLSPSVFDGYLYYFDGNKNYLYRAALQTGEITLPEEENMVVGKMTEEDYKEVFEKE